MQKFKMWNQCECFKIKCSYINVCYNEKKGENIQNGDFFKSKSLVMLFQAVCRYDYFYF